MIKTIEIALTNDNFGLLELSSPYEEFFRLLLIGGGELFSEFAFKVVPIQEKKIIIEIEGANQPQIDTIEKGISNSITTLNTSFNYYGIGFGGFKVIISAGRFHPIDSKSVGYDFTVTGILMRLINENIFQKSIIKYSLQNDLFELVKTNVGKYYRYFERDVSIKIPLKFRESIQLTNNWNAIVIYGDSKEEEKKGKLQIEIQDGFRVNRPNEVAINFEEDIDFELANSIIDQMKEVVNFVYRQEKNLRAVNLNIRLINKWEKSYSRSISLAAISWVFRSILSNKDNYKIEEEKYYKRI